MIVSRINEHVVVRALQKRRLSTTAKALVASLIDDGFDTTSRAVATALRQPVADGRVSINYGKAVARYRFVRLRAKVQP